MTDPHSWTYYVQPKNSSSPTILVKWTNLAAFRLSLGPTPPDKWEFSINGREIGQTYERQVRDDFIRTISAMGYETVERDILFPQAATRMWDCIPDETLKFFRQHPRYLLAAITGQPLPDGAMLDKDGHLSFNKE